MESEGADRVKQTIAGITQETLAGAIVQVVNGYRKRRRLLQHDVSSQTLEMEEDQLDAFSHYLKEKGYKE
jgi:hypothetical protein